MAQPGKLPLGKTPGFPVYTAHSLGKRNHAPEILTYLLIADAAQGPELRSIAESIKRLNFPDKPQLQHALDALPDPAVQLIPLSGQAELQAVIRLVLKSVHPVVLRHGYSR